MNIINIFLPFCRIIESILKKEPLLNLQLYIRQFSSLLSSLTVVANDAFEKIGGGDYFLKIFHHPLPVTVLTDQLTITVDTTCTTQWLPLLCL